MCSKMGQYQECKQYFANVNNIDNIMNDEQVCQIPSIVSNRSVNMLQERKTVNKSNLISVEISASKPKALMGLMNCQSANKNGHYIKDYILEQDLDLAALTETWMVGGDADNVVKSKPIPNGYRMQHVPRIGSRGGGVALIWKAHYAVKLEPAFQASSFESIVLLATIGSKAFRIVVIYRPLHHSKTSCKSPSLSLNLLICWSRQRHGQVSFLSLVILMFIGMSKVIQRRSNLRTCWRLSV